ncbi:hypothetical protein SCHPADRAFT_832792 [Schizopora paradoxa]|uniref:CUE domain-containing protein n=1 Tax=Schizopora paradoxa TaxID=27342 RepID=A0A0H2REH5_9AGAM|nr:hypothetical protein SCHPADRAFT_832792 [Schizopora paradoxa]
MSFNHAAVSKGLMMGYALTSIAASVLDVKHYLHLQLVPHLSKHHQYWRLFVHHLAISNSSELLLTEILLYNVALPVERMFGSTKFASFAFVSILTSTILEFGALIAFNRSGLNVIPSGPFALVFSIIYQYYRLVPHAYSFKIFGVTLTDKAFTYFLGLQLAISQTPGSFAASLIGLIAGQLYRSDILGLKAFRLPRYLQRLSSRLLLPLIGSTKPPRRSNRAFPPDDTSASTSTTSPPSGTSSAREENTEVITTAPASAARRSQENDRAAAAGAGDQSRTRSGGSSSANAQTSVVREWVDEFTGRAERAASGLRVPSDNEINQLMSMFPDLRREVIVGALQRRYVRVESCFRCYANSREICELSAVS